MCPPPVTTSPDGHVGATQAFDIRMFRSPGHRDERTRRYTSFPNLCAVTTFDNL
jgi:hypothetical protein